VKGEKLSDRSLNYVYSPAFVWGPDDKHENMSELSMSGQKLGWTSPKHKSDAGVKSLNLELLKYSHGV